ncbi:two component transcriptional regulator, winged helix family [Clostridium bornimense]|uniref:Stage 0 sporulation protein A homolog n=1 Tax=Clostridium bornimense TaxID=1216932 RepID=W6SIX7_9CLOT|nr:response regulator transcription factor [Clostridium bornimense]CDM69625.1 two component transcriptional regulator, winged helix family [Clostridium bornimense]
MRSILLVEDDNALALGVKYTLENEGFNVLRGTSVEDSKKVFCSNEKIDLILLDLTLPDGSGYDLCKYIREKSNVPIIFLTAMDEEANVVLAFDLGGDDYITKPIRIKELISRINAVLRRSKRDAMDIKRSGEIALDINKAKLLKKDKEIVITTVEYKLLMLFFNNPQKIISRDEIIHNLWDIDGEFVDGNTLSVYIRRLREKIEDNPSKPVYIETLRGLGYKWSKNVI